MDLILMMVALFAVMYFLMIRPQQKRAKQHQEMQSSLAPGSRVLLTSGMFGTVTNVGERQLIVELAPGLEVTVLKGNVARAVTAEEEEFEFTDDAAQADDELEVVETVEAVEPIEAADEAEETAAVETSTEEPAETDRPEDTK